MRQFVGKEELRNIRGIPLTGRGLKKSRGIFLILPSSAGTLSFVSGRSCKMIYPAGFPAACSSALHWWPNPLPMSTNTDL